MEETNTAYVVIGAAGLSEIVIVFQGRRYVDDPMFKTYVNPTIPNSATVESYNDLHRYAERIDSLKRRGCTHVHVIPKVSEKDTGPVEIDTFLLDLSEQLSKLLCLVQSSHP